MSYLRWTEVRLGDICEFKYGKSLREEYRLGGDVPVYGSNGVVGRHNVAVTEGPAIVVGRKGSFGEVHFSEQPCWPIDTTYYVDGTATKVDLRWLARRLSGLGLNQLNRAAAVPGLNREDAYRKRLLLPPLPEQRRIAAILDRADALRARRRAALTQLDTLTQAIFVEMFGDPMEGRWERVKLATLLEAIDSGSSPVCLDRPAIDGEWGVLKLGAVTWGNYDGSENKALPPEIEPDPSLEVRAGDLLFVRKNTYELVGACSLVAQTRSRLLLPDLIFRFRFLEDAPVDASYFRELLMMPTKRDQVRRLAGGTAGSMPNISKGRLENVMVELPPLRLQQRFSARATEVRRLLRAQHDSAAILDALFASLQHRAFRGEL